MKIDKFIFLIIIFIIVLSFGTYWQFKKFRESISKTVFPNFEMPEIKLFSTTGNKDVEFVSPDGKLKLTYSSDWTNIATENLEKMNSEMVKKETKVLFFGNKMNLKSATFASLIIQETKLGERNIEEIIEESKNDYQEGEEVKIVQSKIEEKEANLEIEYKRKEGAIFVSKERILLSEEKAYFVTVFALDSFWPDFKDEAEKILNSAKIIP
jgi:hypothetical protein